MVGVVSLAPGASLSPDAVVAAARERLSSFKLPKQLLIVPRVPRAPNGKADYPAARKIFEASSGSG